MPKLVPTRISNAPWKLEEILIMPPPPVAAVFDMQHVKSRQNPLRGSSRSASGSINSFHVSIVTLSSERVRERKAASRRVFERKNNNEAIL